LLGRLIDDYEKDLKRPLSARNELFAAGGFRLHFGFRHTLTRGSVLACCGGRFTARSE